MLWRFFLLTFLTLHLCNCHLILDCLYLSCLIVILIFHCPIERYLVDFRLMLSKALEVFCFWFKLCRIISYSIKRRLSFTIVFFFIFLPFSDYIILLVLWLCMSFSLFLVPDQILVKLCIIIIFIIFMILDILLYFDIFFLSLNFLPLLQLLHFLIKSIHFTH